MFQLTRRFGFLLIFASVITGNCGIQFSIVRTLDRLFCGRLQCWADKIFTDQDVFAIVSLTIFNVTLPNQHTKLAFLSMFEPDLYVDQAKTSIVNATGNISNYHAELNVALRDGNDCLNGSFVCELGFAHVNGQTQAIKETVSSGYSGNCPVVFNEIATSAITLKTQLDEAETEKAKLKQEIEALKRELSRLEEIKNISCDTSIKNSSSDTPQAVCTKGAIQNNTRETFMLWDKIPALCDTVTDGGGWIIIQRRTKGDIDFYRTWDDYKKGFGTPDTDFWIGNDIIHKLTAQGYTELRIDIESQGKQYFVHYSTFKVADETLNYRLSVSGYNGTTVDNFMANNGSSFSTYDIANNGKNCAVDYHGAWWYNNCGFSDLNGAWGAQNTKGLWFTLGLVTFTEMKIRHVGT